MASEGRCELSDELGAQCGLVGVVARVRVATYYFYVPFL